MSTKPLESLLAIADSGTWGEEATASDGDPVLRSTNIQNHRMDYVAAAWRTLPLRDRDRKRLATGDILVTKSSGSPDHIGKCAIFKQPNNNRAYYFSNFMLRLRPDPSVL